MHSFVRDLIIYLVTSDSVSYVFSFKQRALEGNSVVYQRFTCWLVVAFVDTGLGSGHGTGEDGGGPVVMHRRIKMSLKSRMLVNKTGYSCKEL